MNIDKGDPHVTPQQTKHFSKQQTSLRDTAFFGLEFTIHKAGGTYGNKNRLIQQTLGRPYVSSFPLAPAAQSHPAIWCSTKNQLAGHISACKWNDLFPCNLHDLTDVFPLAAHVTRGLPALTFYKKGRLQLPAACQHQTVTFRTVRFTDLQKKASCFCPSSGSSSLMIALSRSRRRCLSSFYLAWPTQRCFSIPPLGISIQAIPRLDYYSQGCYLFILHFISAETHSSPSSIGLRGEVSCCLRGCQNTTSVYTFCKAWN